MKLLDTVTKMVDMHSVLMITRNIQPTSKSRENLLGLKKMIYLRETFFQGFLIQVNGHLNRIMLTNIILRNLLIGKRISSLKSRKSSLPP